MKLNDLERQTLPRLTSMQANRRQIIYRERGGKREVEREREIPTFVLRAHAHTGTF